MRHRKPTPVATAPLRQCAPPPPTAPSSSAAHGKCVRNEASPVGRPPAASRVSCALAAELAG